MLSRAEARRLKGLHRRKNRVAEGLFLAEGVRVVEELLASPVVPRRAVISSSLEDTERGQALRRELASRVEICAATEAELRELAGTATPQGVVVAAEIPGAGLSSLRPAARSAVLVLDGVQDPGNFGALTRTAAAFGAELLAALPGTVDPWNPKSVRASAGTMFRLPVVTCGWGELREWLESGGYGIYGAAAAGPPVDEVALAPRRALVVGNEGSGLSEAVVSALTSRVAVPMRRGVESLNVAVSAGILLYLFTRDGGFEG